MTKTTGFMGIGFAGRRAAVSSSFHKTLRLTLRLMLVTTLAGAAVIPQPLGAQPAASDTSPPAAPHQIPSLGGPADAVVNVREAQRWLSFRAQREEERFQETLFPEWVKASYDAAADSSTADLKLLDSAIRDPANPPNTLNQLVDLGRMLFLKTHGVSSDVPGLTCESCHWKGGFAGGGDRADNSSFSDPLGAGQSALQPPPLWGLGWTEMVARELTEQLQRQRAVLVDSARRQRRTLRAELVAKGLSFGTLEADRRGKVNTQGLSGVRSDLVVRPFGWRGIQSTIRGMVETELGRFGYQAGPGQIKAITAFLATMDTPRVSVPFQGPVPGEPLTAELGLEKSPEFSARWGRGARLFETLGCASCHTPFLPLTDSRYALGGTDGGSATVDLVAVAARPRPERDVSLSPPERGTTFGDGADQENQALPFLVPMFSDLRLHSMGEWLLQVDERTGEPSDVYLTRPLWGLVNSKPYLHHGAAATLDEAIHLHGGPGSEAGPSARAFGALNNNQKSAVRLYLNSLRRGPAVRVR